MDSPKNREAPASRASAGGGVVTKIVCELCGAKGPTFSLTLAFGPNPPTYVSGCEPCRTVLADKDAVRTMVRWFRGLPTAERVLA